MTNSFYDNLAPLYKWLHQDWDTSVKRHASALDGVIREFVGENAQTILDVACGIGTQSLGLALLGYQVTASDISSKEIEQAKVEAARLNAAVAFQIADMRNVWEIVQKQFDIVIACDNSLPHLLTDEEILQALNQFYQCIRPGGACIISVRDYAQLERKANQKQIYPRSVRPVDNGHIVLFDVWDFYTSDHYSITMYFLEDTGGPDIKVQAIRGGRYYCVEIPLLERLFQEAGFRKITVLRERYFQPILVAVK